MNSKISRHAALIVGAAALLGGAAALATSPSIDPTMIAVIDDVDLNEGMDKDDLQEEALDNVHDGAMDSLEEAQEAQQEAAEATQEAAEATQEGPHGDGDAHSVMSNVMSNVEGV